MHLIDNFCFTFSSNDILSFFMYIVQVPTYIYVIQFYYFLYLI